MSNTARQKWNDVFREELAVVAKRQTGGNAGEKTLVGLGISGGGIRSATFGLGVLEGLKHCGLLRKLDYLSTVSGGGYIGGWLSANCKREADRHAGDWLDPDADWKLSIDHLRRYSNYLSPKLGFFSADTWSIAMVWLRNTLLIQLTVMLAIAMVLLVPRFLFAGFQSWPAVHDWRWTTVALFIIGVVGIAGNQMRLNPHKYLQILSAKWWHIGAASAGLCLVAAWGFAKLRGFDPFAPGTVDLLSAGVVGFLLVVAGFFMLPVGVKLVAAAWSAFSSEDPPAQINYTQGWVQGAVVIPMLLVGFLVGAILWGQSQPDAVPPSPLANLKTFGDFFKSAWHYWPFPLTVTFVSLWVLAFCSLRNWREKQGVVWALIAPFPAIVVLHVALSAIMLLLHTWAGMGSAGKWFAYIWTPSLVLYSFSLSIVMLIGMLGRQSTDDVREWWSRFGAWAAIYGAGWMLLNVVAAYGPYWSALLWNDHPWRGIATSGGWIATTVAGLLAGKSGATSGTKGEAGEQQEKSTFAKVLDAVLLVAPFVFIGGLLIGVSTLLHLVLVSNSDLPWSGAADLVERHWILLRCADLGVTAEILAAGLLVLAILAARVDINEFSLNAFYRSRLVRCYLGAARFHPGERNPQNFTGFDDLDDFNLAELAPAAATPAGPLHIVNCALNLGGSSDLALHTRHSAVFTMTPLHCGSRYLSHDQAGHEEEMGYVRTAIYGGAAAQPTLGQAISVSGAAASPNMGYHTSPVVAFLLTLFNVRLGWWFPNPKGTGINSASPWFSLRYLITELFGGADDRSKYLAISDGGHFENLAGYELVKRRCRVIILCDAECDPDLNFGGLGTLIRVAEVDFNTKITIDVNRVRRGDSGWSERRCAIGRIDYPDAPAGTLIYLKASMTGKEDTAVLEYHSAHSAFPHESTADQFYGEDQFESYRALGREIATQALEPVADEPDFIAAVQKLRGAVALGAGQ